MKAHKEDFDTFLDRAVAAVREDHPDPQIVREAGERVWQRIENEAADASPSEVDRETAPAAEPTAAAQARIRSHEDYLGLIPAYLAGDLPPSSALLVEDYARESIPFRKALHEARSGRKASTLKPRRARLPRIWVALAAALLLALGASTFMLLSNRFAAAGPQLRVLSADGQLCRLDGDRSVALTPGATVRQGEKIRTSKEGGAVVELNDGSRVELRQRSEISVARRRGETTIRVAHGSIIVEAAPQHSGRLHVSTDDCLVSVTGTIFSVNHGTKGSRVSVIEGEVRVDQGRTRTVLEPGDQIATNDSLGAVPVADEVSWSRDGERYRALLAELRQLNSELGKTLARTQLRYESPLLALVAPETVIYLGLPNLSIEVGEMQEILQQRLAESEVLRQWWQQNVDQGGTGEQINDLIDRLRGLGQHLGNEVVVTVARDAEGDLDAPLVLAEVERPGAFAAVLAAEVERLNAGSNDGHLTIISDPSAALPSSDNESFLWLAGDVFAAAAHPQQLQQLAARMAQAPGAGTFTATPFHDRLLESYAQGAQWIAGLDAANVLATVSEEIPPRAMRFSGLDNVEHLIIERKHGDEVVHTGAVLTFADKRTGALSWLAEPAPMGSLDFLSAETTFAASSVVDDPAAVVAQILGFLDEIRPGARSILAGFEEGYGIDLENDLAAALGGEVTVAFDGPALPTPSWKIVAEVYDPARLQSTLDLIVQRVGQTLVINGKPVIHIEEEIAGGRTYYSIPEVAEALGKMVAGLHFTYENGYLLIAPSRALLDRAIQVRDNGYGLTDTDRFRDLLPPDGYVNFSAMVFTDIGSLGETLGRLASAAAANLPATDDDPLGELDATLAPTLACAYGEVDRIRLVSTSQGGALAPLLMSMLQHGDPTR